MNLSTCYLCVCVSGLLFLFQLGTGAEFYRTSRNYPFRLRPDLDIVKDPILYFRTKSLVKLQMRCIFYDGPCDLVGQWAKPRLRTGLLGECLKCTPTQKDWLNKVLSYMADKHPDLFHAAVARFIEYYAQIPLPEEHRRLVAEAFES